MVDGLLKQNSLGQIAALEGTLTQREKEQVSQLKYGQSKWRNYLGLGLKNRSEETVHWS